LEAFWGGQSWADTALVTDLDLRNDENRPSLTSGAVSRTSRSIIEKHDRWDGWRYHWRLRYRSL